MKFLIGIAIVILLYFGARNLLTHWQQVQSGETSEPPATAPTAPGGAVAGESLPGLPPQLESSLAAAKRQGADSLKVWLKNNRVAVRDPRLADIELDYVVLAAGKNFAEAREVFATIKARVTEDSPVYPKLKKLEKNYQ